MRELIQLGAISLFISSEGSDLISLREQVEEVDIDHPIMVEASWGYGEEHHKYDFAIVETGYSTDQVIEKIISLFPTISHLMDSH